MVLHPLTQIGVRVLVPVLIRCCKHVMDLEGSRKWCERDNDERHDKGDRGRDTRTSDGGGRTWDHRRRAYNRTPFCCQSWYRVLRFWLLLLK